MQLFMVHYKPHVLHFHYYNYYYKVKIMIHIKSWKLDLSLKIEQQPKHPRPSIEKWLDILNK